MWSPPGTTATAASRRSDSAGANANPQVIMQPINANTLILIQTGLLPHVHQ
jgi:hypothetical protein